MEKQDQFENKLIRDMEKIGYRFGAGIPHQNYDVFYFFVEVGNREAQFNIGFNDKGLCAWKGFDSKHIVVDDKFGLTYKEALEEARKFYLETTVDDDYKAD